MKTVIFVCVSNTCRSPMAEHIFRMKLKQAGLEDLYSTCSRSISTDYEPEGSPSSPQGVEVLGKKYGLDLSQHKSKLLSQDDVNNAFYIVPVTRRVGKIVGESFTDAQRKIFNLRADVLDPWHQPVGVYESCANHIDTLLDDVVTNLKNYGHK